jgi:uncharacterized RDD family membrane protein YckC
MDSPSYPPPPPELSGHHSPNFEKASFGARLVAVLIDGVVTGIPFVILYLVLKGVGYALGLILVIAYSVYFEGGESGATLGKRAMGIRVSDVHGAESIGYGRALIRYIGKVVSGIPCYLGYFWMLWDSEKQTWQDKIASTYVERT